MGFRVWALGFWSLGLWGLRHASNTRMGESSTASRERVVCHHYFMQSTGNNRKPRLQGLGFRV